MGKFMGSLYNTDIIAWSHEQAALLRAGRWRELDLDNIVEEIEDVGKNFQRECDSRFAVLITHLLKWKYQKEFRSRSWRSTIDTQRSKIARRLRRTPSLRHTLVEEEWLRDVWGDGVDDAKHETGLDVFPDEPLWPVTTILDPTFFPEQGDESTV